MTASNPPRAGDQNAVDAGAVSLLDLLRLVSENLGLLILAPLVAAAAAFAIGSMITPTFTANTKVLPPQQQQAGAATMLQNLGALGGLAGTAAGLKNPVDQYVALAKSRTVQDVLVDRFKLNDRYEAKFREDARAELAANVQVSSGKDGLISIDVSDRDPQFAADLANAQVQELGRLLNRLAVTEAQQRRVFFENQLTQTKDKLALAEQALKGSGVNSSALKSNPDAAVKALASLQAQISAQEVRLASMRAYLAATAPDIRLAQTELAALRGQLAKAEQSPGSPNGSDADYVARYREVKYFEALFELFAKQFELAKVDEAREGAVIQVVDAAVAPERKSRPRKLLLALTAALATGVVLLLALVARHSMRSGRRALRPAQTYQQPRRAWGDTAAGA